MDSVMQLHYNDEIFDIIVNKRCKITELFCVTLVYVSSGELQRM